MGDIESITGSGDCAKAAPRDVEGISFKRSQVNLLDGEHRNEVAGVRGNNEIGGENQEFGMDQVTFSRTKQDQEIRLDEELDRDAFASEESEVYEDADSDLDEDQDDSDVYEEIELEDLDFDPKFGTFTYPCPCGDKFETSLQNLIKGKRIAPCGSCSLRIKVIFDNIEELKDFREQHRKATPAGT